MKKRGKATGKIPKTSVESDKNIHHYQVTLLIHILWKKSSLLVNISVYFERNSFEAVEQNNERWLCGSLTGMAQGQNWSSV